MSRRLFNLLFALAVTIPWTAVRAQQCSVPGQTPETAILVCGSESFYQVTPSFCGILPIPVPCPPDFPYQNLNPVYFRMNCFTSGTLGFIITPDDPGANFDWQLFDITSSNPNSIFTAPSLYVASNWSAEPGNTGASEDGTDITVCGGPGGNTFSRMPSVQAGRSYMLMISNQSQSSAGFQLQFTGGSASITDNVEPHLLKATTGCNANTVVVKMNKKITCGSVAPDGTDFLITGGATILSALAGPCDPGIGTDSVVLTIDQPLLAGNYTISIRAGSDANTVLDICNRAIPPGESIPFQPTPVMPTPMDSVFKTNCAPSYIELVFRKPMLCSSISSDASDFSVSGPQPVIVTMGTPTCNAMATVNRIRLNFDAPLITEGTYTVHLHSGSDGNALFDICGMETPAGSVISFTIDDPVSSAFTIDAPPSCQETKVNFLHDGNNNTLSWKWDFGDGTFSSEQNPVKIYTQSGLYKVKLEVNNGKCTDTSSQDLSITGFLDAEFVAEDVICPEDNFTVVNKSSEGFDQWRWDFGNSTTSDVKDPAGFRYPVSGIERNYFVRLIASHSVLGCADTVDHRVKVLGNCFIAVPTGFTPNGDGKNDYLYPLNALKADNLVFRVFNRYGQQVFYSNEWTKKWDGRINGLLQPTGVYAWLLSYTHRDTKTQVSLRGTTVLIR